MVITHLRLTDALWAVWQGLPPLLGPHFSFPFVPFEVTDTGAPRWSHHPTAPHFSTLFHLTRHLPTLAMFTCGGWCVILGGRAILGTMGCSEASLPFAHEVPALSPSCDIHKFLQMLPSIPMRQSDSWWRSAGIEKLSVFSPVLLKQKHFFFLF